MFTVSSVVSSVVRWRGLCGAAWGRAAKIANRRSPPAPGTDAERDGTTLRRARACNTTLTCTGCSVGRASYKGACFRAGGAVGHAHGAAQACRKRKARGHTRWWWHCVLKHMNRPVQAWLKRTPAAASSHIQPSAGPGLGRQRLHYRHTVAVHTLSRAGGSAQHARSPAATPLGARSPTALQVQHHRAPRVFMPPGSVHSRPLPRAGTCICASAQSGPKQPLRATLHSKNAWPCVISCACQPA